MTVRKENSNDLHHFSIEKLTSPTSSIIADISELLPRLYKDSDLNACEDRINRIINSQNSSLIISKNEAGKVVGITTLVSTPGLVNDKFWIEDVIVGEEWEGKGVARRMLTKAINIADEQGANAVNLTSRSERVSANALYQKLGFTLIDTNYYRYWINRSK